VGLQKSTALNAAQFVSANAEYLSVTDNAALSIGDQDFTVAGWVYIDSKATYGTIFSKGNPVSATPGQGEYGLMYKPSGDRFMLIMRNADGSGGTNINADTLGSPSTGQWYFVAAWYNAATDTAQIQVNNGAVDSVSIASGPYDGANAGQIGRIAAGFSSDARVDGVGVWKRSLSADERATLYNGGRGVHSTQLTSSLKTSLQAYWDLDEGSTGVAATTRRDAIGSNHLTDNATVTSNTGKTRTGDFLWVGSNGSLADDGAVTAISLGTDRQVSAYTAANSGLPDNDVLSLALGSGGLALVGTNDAGAWAPGMAGFVVEDLASAPATVAAPVRAKGGTIRIKGGTVRVRPQ
jgi:hypothetical protein